MLVCSSAYNHRMFRCVKLTNISETTLNLSFNLSTFFWNVSLGGVFLALMTEK